MIEYVKQNIKRQSLHDDTHFRHFSNTFSWAFVNFSLIFWYFCHFVVNFVHRRALLHISYNKTHIKVVLFFQFHTIIVFFYFWCSFFRWKRRIFVVFSGKCEKNHCFLSPPEPQNQFEFNYEILQINPDFNILQPRIIWFFKLWPVLAGQGGGQRSWITLYICHIWVDSRNEKRS